MFPNKSHFASVRLSNLLVMAGCLGIAPGIVFAEYTGVDGGEYTTGSNWAGGVVPISGDSQITNKTVVSNGDVTSTGRLLIGYMGSNGGSLTIQSGTLTFGGNTWGSANYVGVESSGHASLTLNGGNFVSTTGTLWLAGNGGTGSADLNVYSGSSLVLQSATSGNLNLGNNGAHTATANFYGGNISVGGTMYGGYTGGNISNLNWYSGSVFSTAKTNFGASVTGTVNLNFYVEASDWVSVNFGDLTIGNGATNLTLTLGGDISEYSVGQQIDIWKTTSGNFSTVLPNLNIQVSGLEGTLDKLTGKFLVTAVPEPSTYVLAGIGLVAGVAMLRRRKTK